MSVFRLRNSLWFRLLLWPGGILVLVCGVFLIWNFVSGRSSLQKALKRFEQDGYPTTFAEVIPTVSISEEKTFLDHPFLQAQFEFYVDLDTQEMVYLDPELQNQLREASSAIFTGPKYILEGAPSLFSFKRADPKAAADTFGLVNNGQVDLEGLEKQFAPSDALFTELIEAARLPAGQMDLYRREGPTAEPRYPDFNVWTSLIRFSSDRSVIQLLRGNSAQAYEEISVLFRAAETVEEHPMLLPELVRSTMLQFGLNIVWEGCAGRVWEKAERDALLKELQRPNARSCLMAAMLGDTLSFSENLQQTTIKEAFDAEFPMLVFPGVIAHNRANLLDSMLTRVIQPLRDETWEFFPQNPVSEGMERMMGKPNWYFPITDLVSHEGVIRQSIYLDAYMCMAQIALVLEGYYEAHAKYPQSMTDIEGQLPADTLVDPMSQQPFGYRREGETFRLYSVGWNQVDEGGKTETLSISSRRFDLYKGDWVWAYEE